MAYIPQSGSVVAFQSDPTKLQVTASVAGQVGASVIGLVPVSLNAYGISFLPINGSVSGTLGASVIGLTPVAVTNIPSVSGQVGASIIGQLPGGVALLGSVVALQGAGWSGSVAAIQTGIWNQSVTGIIPLTGINNLGKVVNSVFGSTDVGVTILSYRNDLLASVASANLRYNINASDSAGRNIIKPFISEDGTVIRYSGSIVSTSVTLIKASAVGLKNYITDFWLGNTGTAGTLVTFKDGSTSIIGYAIAPTLGGISSPGLAIPLVTAPGQDLVFQPGTATSILYLTVNGYQAP